MDKDFWAAFLRFLDQATREELNQKITATAALLQNTRSVEVKSDAKVMIRLMEQELLVRLSEKIPKNFQLA